MKTVLFVPGYPEDLDSRDYAGTMRAIEKRGYIVVYVPIEWKRRTIDNWVQELENVYTKHDPRNTILAGFSFGAMTAFTAAAKVNPSELWLFSLSSYFAEDLLSKAQNKSWLKIIGHRRVEAFSKLKFEELANKISCKTLLFYGQKELDNWPIMNERAQSAHRLLRNNTFIPIPGVGHDVADKIYVEAIESLI